MLSNISGRLAFTRLACLLLIFYGPLFPAGARAAAPETALWHKANTFYQQKEYDSAYAVYGRLLQAYPANPELQYNMANTCYRLNKVGQAILHYERAAHLQPGNKQVQDNLQLARARVQNPLPVATPIFFQRWWHSFVLLWSSNTWAVLSLVAFACLLLLVYYARVRKERFVHAGRWLSLAIVALMICGCMLYFTYDLQHNSGKAVVLQPAASLLDAPRATGKVTGSLPEGTVVEVYGEENGFINVKLPNGGEGWMAAAAMEKV